MSRRSILFALFASVTLAFGVLTAVPASADPVDPLTVSVDKSSAGPGETVTVEVTFTNPQAVDLTFSYLSFQPEWQSEVGDADFDLTSCTGDVSFCSVTGSPGGHSGYMTHDVVIEPADTRTATFTYQVDPEEDCEGLHMYVQYSFYTYYESSAGNVGQIVSHVLGDDLPATFIDC